MQVLVKINFSLFDRKAARILSGRRFETCFQKLFHDLIYLAVKSKIEIDVKDLLTL